MYEPKESHWEVVVHVLIHIKEELGLGLLMSSKQSNAVTALCDADWASYSAIKKSTCVKLGNSSWKSKKQTTVSSTAEAEYRSMTITVAELV